MSGMCVIACALGTSLAVQVGATSSLPPLVEPLSPHAHEAEAHAFELVHPDHTRSVVGGAFGGGFDPVTFPKPCATVFGFLPYWSGTSNIRWDLLTHVACFDVQVAADGSVITSNGWPWNNTILTARAAGVKVILTVTNFTPSQILTLLNSSANRSRLITNLVNLTRGTADGVCVDFEGTASNGWASRMPTFVRELKAALRADNPEAEVWVATPAVNYSSSWPLTQLATEADGLFMMAYAYAGSWSTTTGANAPLDSSGLSVTDSLNIDYANVLANRPTKLVLGLPWYGNTWTAASASPGAATTTFVSSATFASATSQAATYGRRWDAPSSTPYVAWQQSGTWRQTWYDDAQSLGLKYQLARARGMGGVGMWALGYQGTTAAMWDVITQNFIDPCPVCPSDINKDRMVDFGDFLAFFSAYDTSDPDADIDGNPGIDFGDFLAFFNSYDEGC